MVTKPKGIHANFAVDCRCGSEFTVTNGRRDPHDCREPQISKFAPNSDLDLEQIMAALDNR